MEFKYWGMWLDERCTWKIHVDKTRNKMQSNLSNESYLDTTGEHKQALIDYIINKALMRSAINCG